MSISGKRFLGISPDPSHYLNGSIAIRIVRFIPSRFNDLVPEVFWLADVSSCFQNWVN